MPRDCTAPKYLGCTVPFHVAVSNTNMAPRNNKKKINKRKPRNIQVIKKKQTPFQDVGRIVGQTLGSYFGPAGGNFGRAIGGTGGSLVGKIFGSGPYKLKSNTVWNTSNQVPVMHSSCESVVLTHREYIRDVYSSVNFATSRIMINPGLEEAFPFLSAVAQNFQEYRFKGLAYEFISTSADALNSTNTALGSLMLAVDYVADDVAYLNKQEMLNEMWSASTRPSENLGIPVECDPDENPMNIQYVRSGPLAPNADKKMYDLGTLTVATVGSQAISTIGELWVTYHVELKKPRLFVALGSSADVARIARSGATGSTPFGTATIESKYYNIDVVFNSSSLITLNGLVGTYTMSIQWVNSAAVSITMPTVAYTNAVPVAYITGSPTMDTGGTNVNVPSMNRSFTVTDSSLPVTITLGTAGTVNNGANTGIYSFYHTPQ
jgi:hypothetical protein